MYVDAHGRMLTIDNGMTPDAPAEPRWFFSYIIASVITKNSLLALHINIFEEATIRDDMRGPEIMQCQAMGSVP